MLTTPGSYMRLLVRRNQMFDRDKDYTFRCGGMKKLLIYISLNSESCKKLEYTPVYVLQNTPF